MNSTKLRGLTGLIAFFILIIMLFLMQTVAQNNHLSAIFLKVGGVIIAVDFISFILFNVCYERCQKRKNKSFINHVNDNDPQLHH